MDVSERKKSLRPRVTGAKKNNSHQAKSVSFYKESSDSGSSTEASYSDDEIHKTDVNLEDEEDIVLMGSDVFQFQTPKRKKAVSSKSSISKSTAKKTSLKKAANSKTPSSARSGRRQALQKDRSADTPYKLRRLIRKRLVDLNLTDVQDSSSDDDTDSDDGNDKDESAAAAEELTSVARSACTRSTHRAEPSTGQISTRRYLRSRLELDQQQMVEDYFDAHASSASTTSDRTLSRLRNPRLNQDELLSVLKSAPVSHRAECAALYEEHRCLFEKWMFQLSEGYNILLYGLGSKRVIIDEFRNKYLLPSDHLVINGYFPSLTVKQILDCITVEALGSEVCHRNPLDQVDYIKQCFTDSYKDEFYLLIHNIDGAAIRGDRVQTVLGMLAELPRFHVLASIDHINAPLIWDQHKASRFNWLWYDVTTFEPYAQETSYENSLLVQQSGVLALSSLTHVYHSLTPNARGIFMLLAQHQVEEKDSPGYVGLSFQDCYQKCREAFLVNSEITLRAQLIEFRDHNLLKSRKGVDGMEYLQIPLENSMLTEFVEQQRQE